MRRMVNFLFALLLQMGLAIGAFAEGTVTGYVYEQDGISPIADAAVTFYSISISGTAVEFRFVTDSYGWYGGIIDDGYYHAVAVADGYSEGSYPQTIVMTNGIVQEHVDFVLYEIYSPVQGVIARRDGSMLKVSWKRSESAFEEDFESGDFSKFDWDNSVSAYPWVISTDNPCDGTFCMKSSCEGVSLGVSAIEVPMNLNADSRISFSERISSESPWDCGYFFVDGVKIGEYSGDGEWKNVSFNVSRGFHVFRWSYVKDASIDAYDDCFCIDNIRFSQLPPKETEDRSFQYFNLYRRRFSESPMIISSHLRDSSFIDMGWNGLQWGRYSYGVSCVYEGNRGESPVVWSNELEKDMRTSLDLTVTANTGLVPLGAYVDLISLDSIGLSYSATIGATGRHLFENIKRGDYRIFVRLEGYHDSNIPIAILEESEVHVELIEKICEIDSLYVSSTGWAMWSLRGEDGGAPQYYEIVLDTVSSDSVVDMHYQFDVSELTEDFRYRVMVRPVFLSGSGDWALYDWIYRSCEAYQGTFALEASNESDGSVLLRWEFPDNDSVIGAMLYRDELCIGFSSDTQYVDNVEDLEGSILYCVRAVYDGDKDGTYYSMACAECVQIWHTVVCKAPKNLVGENYYHNDADFGVMVYWGIRPEPIEGWLYYDDGTFETSLGAEGMFFWGIKFEPEDLLPYQGTSISKVSLYDVAAGTYQIWIYFGEEINPHALVHYQDCQLDGSNDWHEETLRNSLPLQADLPLWIVIGQHGAAYPAAACKNTGNRNGSWVSIDGDVWTDLSEYNLDYTWMLRAFVSNQTKESIVQPGRSNLLAYQLYRSYDNIDYDLIASVPALEGADGFYQYKDVLVEDLHQVFYYQVTALYDSGCESDPAASLADSTQHFVVVDAEWSLPESVQGCRLFPNPTDGLLYVQGEGVVGVTLIDSSGRQVYSDGAMNGMHQLNLADYADGLYLLQIFKQNGTETHRIMVSH